MDISLHTSIGVLYQSVDKVVNQILSPACLLDFLGYLPYMGNGMDRVFDIKICPSKEIS